MMLSANFFEFGQKAQDRRTSARRVANERTRSKLVASYTETAHASHLPCTS